MLLTDAAVKRPTTVWVLTLLIILIGAYSYVTLPREGAPDVPIPYVMVTTTYKGISPEDIESSVTLKIERQLSGLKGLKELRSTSAEGMSVITIEFMPDIVIDDALQYVRARVDLAKGDLPADADEPSIQEINISEFPIIYLNIAGNVSPVRLKAIADDLQDAIEAVPGVLSADIVGALEREIRLEFNPDRLAEYNLTIPEVTRLIPAENVNVSAGGLQTPGTRFYVRVPAEFVEPGEVDNLLLTVRNGRPIYLADIARVTDTFKDRTNYARLNGKPSVTVLIRKRTGSNVIEISDRIRGIVDEARKQAPGGVVFDYTFDMSKYIRDMVRDLENNMASGFILVVVCLVLFMGFRSSLIVSTAIPLSMLISFAIISAIGYTLNMIVLFSLILALGMLVDNGIVIVENIYRHTQMGYSRIEAAILGAREVAWPVITSTFTTVAAFLPLAFWPGIVGDFMKYLPITLMITLLSSLFVALVVNPTICAVVGEVKAPKRVHDHWFLRGYRAFVSAAIRHRFATLYLSILVLVGMGALYAMFGHGVEFFPSTDPDRAMINIAMPQGSNIEDVNALTQRVEGIVEKYRADLSRVVANVGQGASMEMDFGGGGGGGEHRATVMLVFHDFEMRERPSMEIITALRRDLQGIPGAEIRIEKEKEGPPTGKPVTIRIIGKDFKELESLNATIKTAIAGVPGLVNLNSDLEATRPELAFRVDRRRAALLGLDSNTIGEFLKMAVFGRKAGTFRDYNDEHDITIRLPLERRTSIDDLLRLRIPNPVGEAVPLSSLGEFDYAGGFGTIYRVSQKRVVTVTADAEGRLNTEVLKDVQDRLKPLKLKPGYEIVYAGEQEESDKASAFLTRAFVLAVLLIVLILISQFDSIIVPLVIMTTVILSIAGALLGLTICGMPFGILMTGIGFISLAGVVVNNAIVLLDFTMKLQRRGRDVVEAAIEAGQTRLRPVLLTAMTTIIGLIPMATGVSFDFHTMAWATRSHSTQWWVNMSVVVIFGLGLATILTLVVIPSLYVSGYKLLGLIGIGQIKPDTERTGVSKEGD